MSTLLEAGTAQAILLREYGGPEVLRMEEVPVGPPASGQLRVRHEAVAVNYHDTYVRSGLYRTLALPGIPGLEAAGVVEAVGPDVTGFAVGDRIVYLDSGYGAYASARVLDAGLAVRLPDNIPTDLAAGFFLKGLTAAILVTRVHPVRAGDRVLVHAAAGGVGRLLAQWAAEAGARVIGTVGTAAKAEIARASGCEAVIVYTEEDFPARVREITGGHGADVVYDAVGRDTFDGSLASLALCGHLVNYGQSSGSIPPFEIARLAPKSASISRPGYAHYIRERANLERLASDLWLRMGDGRLQAEIGGRYPLADAAAAHRALEARAVGPLVLLP